MLDFRKMSESKERKDILTFHHSRPIESVKFGVIKPESPLLHTKVNDEIDQQIVDSFERSYRWLETHLGFFPLFISVGRKNPDVLMTGYQNQWMKVVGTNDAGNIHIKAGESPNIVLFSYSQIPRGSVFMDFDIWNQVLALKGLPPSSRLIQSLFKPSYIRNDWISKTIKSYGTVQLVVPELDLSKAEFIAVRNKKTKKELVNMGFKPEVISIKRMLLDRADMHWDLSADI